MRKSEASICPVSLIVNPPPPAAKVELACLSFSCPAQVGIDLRNKRVGSAEALDRERPMSWEGELSDQEVSQMDQETNGAHHSADPSTAETPNPPQQPPPPLPAPTPAMAIRPLKTEPIHEEEAEEELDEDEHEMEGIQSAGPGSPQPMCTNAGEEALDAGEQHLIMPPPAHHPPPAEIKTELPWTTECPKAELAARPSPPLSSSAAINSTAGASNAGSTPTAPQQRPTFGEAFTGHTPLASPLTSRHPIRLPLAAASGKTAILTTDPSVFVFFSSRNSFPRSFFCFCLPLIRFGGTRIQQQEVFHIRQHLRRIQLSIRLTTHQRPVPASRDTDPEAA